MVKNIFCYYVTLLARSSREEEIKIPIAVCAEAAKQPAWEYIVLGNTTSSVKSIES